MRQVALLVPNRLSLTDQMLWREVFTLISRVILTGNRMVDTATQNLNWFQILDAQKVLDNIPNNEYDMGNIVVLCTVDNGHSLNSTTQYAIHRDFRTGDGLNTAMKFSANKANMINGISVVPLRNVTFPVFNATPRGDGRRVK